jgi:PAS domain S-box-containing protein
VTWRTTVPAPVSARQLSAAVIVSAMRDQHRPKQELINEVAALRKQVIDLKDAMTARRRVEDALRLAEEQLHALADGAPVGLCLFRTDGTPLLANRPFARLLGYESPSELLRMATVLGVFADREEQMRVLAVVAHGKERVSGAVFRRRDGSRQAYGVIGTASEGEAVVLAVLERQPQPWRAPPLVALSSAWSAGTHRG